MCVLAGRRRTREQPANSNEKMYSLEIFAITRFDPLLFQEGFMLCVCATLRGISNAKTRNSPNCRPAADRIYSLHVCKCFSRNDFPNGSRFHVQMCPRLFCMFAWNRKRLAISQNIILIDIVISFKLHHHFTSLAVF